MPASRPAASLNVPFRAILEFPCKCISECPCGITTKSTHASTRHISGSNCRLPGYLFANFLVASRLSFREIQVPARLTIRRQWATPGRILSQTQLGTGHWTLKSGLRRRRMEFEDERDLWAPYQVCLCSTLENAFAFQPYFKTAAHKDKVIPNTVL